MNSQPFRPDNQKRRLMVLAVGGALVLACGAVAAPDRTWSNVLVAAYYLLTLGLGGAVFLALTYISNAGWSVAFRRVPEAMAMITPFAGAALLLVLVLGMHKYGWRYYEEGGGDPGTFWFKEYWLTPSFWLVRAALYVAVWSLLIFWLVARSRKQDATGDALITAGNIRLSALFLAVYAVTISMASVDWLMALEPMWFSTMWGVYNFAGMIQAGLAVVIILGLLLRSHGGPLHGVFSDEHLHDLGKLLLGFSCFWVYIWFSQYMLIWYANMPEETSYFITRTHGPWGPIVVLSIVLNWVVPFFGLLPKTAKRSASVMMKIAVVVLVGRWVDLYLMVFPAATLEAVVFDIQNAETPLFEFTKVGTPVFGLWEVAAICCLIGTAGLLLFRSFSRAKPVPSKDPFLSESLHYHAG